MNQYIESLEDIVWEAKNGLEYLVLEYIKKI